MTDEGAGAVPPPPGAPGPGYLPPPSAAREPEPVAEVLTSGGGWDGDGPRRSGRRTAVLLTLAVAVLVGTGIYLGFLRHPGGRVAGPSASPAAGTYNPAPAPGPRRGVPTDPDATPLPLPLPPRTTPFHGPHLEFTLLPRPWARDDASADMFRGPYAQTQVTEARYDGSANWVALLSTGVASPDSFDSKQLDASAGRIVAEFARSGFAGVRVARKSVSSKVFTVDGKRGHLLQQHFTYRVPGLSSRGEAVWVGVVDLGVGKGGAVFLASIPDTHAKLAADVRRAIASLHVVN